MPVRSFRSRRQAPPSAEGRWSLVSSRAPAAVSPTEWSTATAQQLLARYGVVTRDVAAAEGITGGFSAVYDVLKALEDAGRIRRGYFVAGVGATQFALPAALDCSARCASFPRSPRSSRGGDRSRQPLRHDPALARAAGENDAARRTTRSVGSLVVLVNGALGAYISRGARQLQAFLPEDEPARSTVGRGVAGRLAALAREGRHARRRSQWHPDRGAPHRAVPHRGRLRAVSDGLSHAENSAWTAPNFQLPNSKKRNWRQRLGAYVRH
jgi:ATP-dependent Lhr-like helicase